MKNHLSYLMGASSATDQELEDLGIKIVGKSESGSHKLEVPTSALGDYKLYVKAHLKPGFWNEVVGTESILFIFKHKDGKIEELEYSAANKEKIGQLCSEFNGDPIEKTSKVLEYLAGNEFYSDYIRKYYLN